MKGENYTHLWAKSVLEYNQKLYWTTGGVRFFSKNHDITSPG